MRKIILLGFIVAYAANIFAQKLSNDFEITVSKPYKVIDAKIKDYEALPNGDGVMLKKDGKEIYLQKFDIGSMTETGSKLYTDMPERMVYIGLKLFASQMYFFYGSINDKAKAVTVFALPINEETGLFEKPIELFTTSRKVVGNGPFSQGIVMSDNDGSFVLHTSFDKSKLMISYRLSPLSRKDSENYDELGFFVFDSNLNKIVEKEVKMKYTEAQINNIAYGVTNKGVAMGLFLNNQDKKYEWMSIGNDGEVSFKKLNISADKVVQKVIMRENKAGNMVCGTFYANGIEFKMSFTGGTRLSFNANGAVYFEVSPDGTELNQKTVDFPLEFIQQNLSDSQKEKAAKREGDGKAGIADLTLTHFEIKSDGSAIIVGERRWMANEMYGISNENVYHFADMVVIKLSAKGELDWMRKLPKNQAGINGVGQMSFSYLPDEKSDVFAYIDNPKNDNLDPKGGVPVAHKDGNGGYLTSYKVDLADGSIQKSTLAPLENIKGVEAFQFKAYRIFKSIEDTFLMEVYIKGKKDVMVKFVSKNYLKSKKIQKSL